MKVEKERIPEEIAINHCMKNILSGDYRYIYCIDLHKSDEKVLIEWLHDCEIVNQDYFFIYFNDVKEYKRLYGCSSFRIPNLYDSKVYPINIFTKSDEEKEAVITMWVRLGYGYLISGSIEYFTNKILSAYKHKPKTPSE